MSSKRSKKRDQPRPEAVRASGRDRSWRSYGIVVRTWLVFAGVFALLQAATNMLSEAGQARVTDVLAWLTAGTVSLLGADVTASGSYVVSSDTTIEIVWQCSGATPMIIFAAAVLAYPCAWRLKALGVALGLPALFVANMARLVSLYYVSLYFQASFETVHLRVWQPLLIAVTVMLYLVWLVRFVPRERARPA